MKRFFPFALILCAQGLFSQSSGGFNAPGFTGMFRVPSFEAPVPLALENGVPAKLAETGTRPLWIKDLRRAEIVAFGSIPLTLFWTTFFMDLYRCAVHDWDTRYAPWPVKSSGAIGMTNTEIKMMFAIAGSASLTIALLDHIIVRIKRAKARRYEYYTEPIIKGGF